MKKFALDFRRHAATAASCAVTGLVCLFAVSCSRSNTPPPTATTSSSTNGAPAVTNVIATGITNAAPVSLGTSGTNESTNTVAANSEEIDAAWAAVRRATQPPMPPAAWMTNAPTVEQQKAYYLPIVLKGADLAKDFYTRYPDDSHVSEAHRIEMNLLQIATQQFGDTNQAERFAALQTKRMSDPNVSEEERVQWRVDDIKKLMRGMPGTQAEFEKAALAFQKDFPKREEPYEVLMALLTHSQGEEAAKWNKVIQDSPASENVKAEAEIDLQNGQLAKLLHTLPDTRDELLKATKALMDEFPKREDVYHLILAVMSQSDKDTGDAIGKQVAASSAPDDVKDLCKVQLRINELVFLQNGLPETREELVKATQIIQDDFPFNADVYQALLGITSRSGKEIAQKVVEQVAASPISDTIKQLFKLQLQINELNNLAAGLPGTRDELEKASLAMQKDFPDRKEVYPPIFKVMARSDKTTAEALGKQLMDSPAPDAIKQQVPIQLRVAGLRELVAGLPQTSDDLEKAARAFRTDYPDVPQVFYEIMMILLQHSTGDKMHAIAQELSQPPTPPQIQEEVAGMMKQIEAVGKPLPIQFTAEDGRPVNLEDMKGKVVLVDFWATWCGPCMALLPDVKSAYDKLHDKGFDIVGISLDQDEGALRKTTKRKGMAWPQYFDGQGWGNKIAKEYGIHQIPTMWLLDKKGVLRDLGAVEGLQEKINRLLNEN